MMNKKVCSIETVIKTNVTIHNQAKHYAACFGRDVFESVQIMGTHFNNGNINLHKHKCMQSNLFKKQFALWLDMKHRDAISQCTCQPDKHNSQKKRGSPDLNMLFHLFLCRRHLKTSCSLTTEVAVIDIY